MVMIMPSMLVVILFVLGVSVEVDKVMKNVV